MKLIKTLMAGAAAVVVLPGLAGADGDRSSYSPEAAGQRYAGGGAVSSGRALSDDDIRDIIARSGAPGDSPEVRYMGGPETAAETILCCEAVEERIETRSETDETTTYVDVVANREIVQPVQRTLIQPIERRLAQGRTEEETEARRFEENRLPVRIERDPVPAVAETYIPQVTTQTREEVTETTLDVVTRRDVIQPIERTTVVPVQRRIVRPRTETIVNDTRYETNRLELQRRADPIPATVETVTEEVSTLTETRYTDVTVPYVATRNVYQPVTRTTVQPVERQILRGTSETLTEPTRYEEERRATRIDAETAPQLVETLIPRVSQRTLLEVEDVYIDQVTRNVIQPVIVTTVQPIEYVRVNGRTEKLTNPVRYEEQVLAGKVEADPIPQTVVNYIPQLTEDYAEERSETYFDAVVKRDIYQPVVRTIVQPVEIRKVNARTETMTNTTRYETVRASLVVLNLGAPCNCK